jgi:hypothetical protein
VGKVVDDKNTEATRRTHIVRVTSGGAKADVEVLDAIAFRNVRGEEMIIDFKSDNIDPVIIDDTGENNGKPGDSSTSTRRSHMQRITNEKTGAFFDAEVLDIVACRDQNGQEWIVVNATNDPDVAKAGANEFNATTGAGDTTATRRTHNEIIQAGFPAVDPGSKPSGSYLTVTRTDMVAFRNVRGEEMILKLPSSDDPNDATNPRAATYVWSPTDPYDPTDPSSATPPDNSDPNIYLAVPDGGSLFTGDTPVSQGLLWWIRNIVGGDIIVVQIDITTQHFKDFASGEGGEGSNDPIQNLPGIGVDSNFGLAASEVDDTLPLPAMPRNQQDIKSNLIPAINMTDGAWQTYNQLVNPNRPPSRNFDYTVLLFLNPSAIETKDNGEKTQLVLGIPVIHLNFSDPISGIGYYIWATSNASGFINLPEPDASNAFDPISAVTDLLQGAGSYIGIWNNPGTYIPEGHAFTYSHAVVPAGTYSTSLRIGGFSSAAAAAAYAEMATADSAAQIALALALANAQLAADQAALAEVLSKGFANIAEIRIPYDLAIAGQERIIADTANSAVTWTSFTIPFDDGASPGPQPEIDLTITVADFNGKTTFDYDANNQPLFQYPTNTPSNTPGGGAQGDPSKFFQTKFGFLPALRTTIEGVADPTIFPGTKVLIQRAPDPQSGKKIFSIADVGPDFELP